MTNIKLSVTPKIPTSKVGTVFVIGVTGKADKLSLLTHRVKTDSIAHLDFASLGASSKFESLIRVPGENGSVVALIGVGSEELDEDSLRELAASATRKLTGFREIVFDLPTDDERDAVCTLEGALLATSVKLSSIVVLSDFAVSKREIERSRILANSVDRVRDLVNSPPNVLYPQSFASIVSKEAKDFDVSVEILDEKALKAGTFGGILAVGQGSTRPPRLVKVEYSPKQAKTHLALVGKGITFDTGGISIKPSASMVGMKYDMTGAATVYQAILAISALKLPVKVTSYLCLAENMPSGSATRPNDVIKIRNGKTVEVLNTDAEGRLVLADGLSAASELKPDLIIDVATLTGAARVALGDRYSALMGTSDAVSAVEAAAFDSGELVWHMPLPAEMRSRLDTDVADIANAKMGSTAGGMLLAGVFLREFVGSSKPGAKAQPWAHLDIAGTANNDSAPYGYTAKGATGVLLRTLVCVAEGMSR